MTGFNCDGAPATTSPGPTTETFTVTPAFITSGRSLECTFTNLFTPDGDPHHHQDHHRRSGHHGLRGHPGGRSHQRHGAR